MRVFGQVLVVLVTLSGFGATASAQTIPVVNAGFEADPVPPGAFIALVPQGWTVYDPLGIVNQATDAVGLIRPLPGQDFFPGGVPEGNNAALIYLAGAVDAEVGLEQTLATTLTAATRYTLTVQVGNIASGTSLPGSSDGGNVFYNLDGFPGYRIDFMAGNTVLASDDNSLGGTIPEGEWRLATVTFETGASHPLLGEALRIRLVNLDLSGSQASPNIEVDFDDVQLRAVAVPEPSTFALCLVGSVWFAQRRWPRYHGKSMVGS